MEKVDILIWLRMGRQYINWQMALIWIVLKKEKMAISKIQNISKEELTRIEKVIGESFVTNELFHNWGTIEERRSAVLAYMKISVNSATSHQFHSRNS